MIVLTRILQLVFVIILLFIFILPIFFISIAIKLSSKGPVIHLSKRIGRNNKIFLMPKFRTMHINSPNVATHLLNNDKNYITKIGKILRKLSLDEIPQLYSVLIGHMNFIGPRPALYNQYDLINLRTKNNIHKLKPGITGLAQVNGRDLLSIDQKVKLDNEYMKKKSFTLDLNIIVKTFFSFINKKDITH